MSTRKKVNEAGDGTVINEGTIDPALPPIEVPLPVAADTPSDGQAVAADSIEAALLKVESITAQDVQSVEALDGPITGDGSGEACPPIKGWWIRARSEQGFWRCGMHFTREGVGVALSALTEAQLEQLANEPHLIVKPTEFSDPVEPQP